MLLKIAYFQIELTYLKSFFYHFVIATLPIYL